MEKKEREEMIRWLRDRDAGMLLLGIAHLGKMAEFMSSDTNELDKKIKESTDTLVDYVQKELDKAREEGREMGRVEMFRKFNKKTFNLKTKEDGK